jgi:3-oxoacyl-[acyl-carrier protein] reductase
MDLGIRGRKAIVCASSQGLGQGCTTALAEACFAGHQRPQPRIARTDGAGVASVDWNERHGGGGGCVVRQGQAALLDACPNPDTLINNNAGPPYRDFRELDRQALLNGLTMNMLTPIELIQKVIDSMQVRQFGRIVNITSASVKMPFAGLDLSSGARAGLIAFVAGIARSVVHRNVTINALLPGSFDTARLR